MAMLQKFKLLATPCAIMNSPTLSPSTSPLIQLRRRKSLRMLLTRRSSSRRQDSHEQQLRLITALQHQPEKKNNELGSHSLKDLFVSSPPFEGDHDSKSRGSKGEALVFRPSVLNSKGGRAAGWRCELPGSPRPVWMGFRHRLIRRAWRPMLGTILE